MIFLSMFHSPVSPDKNSMSSTSIVGKMKNSVSAQLSVHNIMHQESLSHDCMI